MLISVPVKESEYVSWSKVFSGVIGGFLVLCFAASALLVIATIIQAFLFYGWASRYTNLLCVGASFRMWFIGVNIFWTCFMLILLSIAFLAIRFPKLPKPGYFIFLFFVSLLFSVSIYLFVTTPRVNQNGILIEQKDNSTTMYQYSDRKAYLVVLNANSSYINNLNLTCNLTDANSLCPPGQRTASFPLSVQSLYKCEPIDELGLELIPFYFDGLWKHSQLPANLEFSAFCIFYAALIVTALQRFDYFRIHSEASVSRVT